MLRDRGEIEPVPKLDGWLQRDGLVPLARMNGVSVTDLGPVVGFRVGWAGRTWALPQAGPQTLQVGFPVEIAREIAAALLEAADRVERESIAATPCSSSG